MKGHQAPHVKTYIGVFLALMVLTAVTVAVSRLHLPKTAGVFVALLIAACKAGLVAAFFMHLRGERSLIYGVLALTLFFVGMLVIFPMADTSANSPHLVKDEASVAGGHAGHHAAHVEEAEH